MGCMSMRVSVFPTALSMRLWTMRGQVPLVVAVGRSAGTGRDLTRVLWDSSSRSRLARGPQVGMGTTLLPRTQVIAEERGASCTRRIRVR